MLAALGASRDDEGMTSTAQPTTPATTAISASASLHLLAELSQSFTRSQDLDATLALALQHITQITEAEAASVFLLEPSGDELLCRASLGPVPITGIRVPARHGISGRTLSSGECQLVRDVRQDQDFNQAVDKHTGFQTRSMMCTPLLSGERRLGVVQVLNKRHGDGLFNPLDLDVLRVLGAATALAVDQAQRLTQVFEQTRMRQELELARQLQRRLLPAAQASPFPLLGANLPAREVSGDFYDYYPLPDGRIGFCLGDVSGKGVNAALVMAQTMSLLSGLTRAGLPLEEVLHRANDELCETRFQGMFVCVFAGIFDPASRILEWCNAGLNPAMYQHPDGHIDTLAALTPPLGIVAELEFPVQRFSLRRGMLLCYSDGVTESRDAAGNELGEAGLREQLHNMLALPLDERLGRLLSLLRERELKDDTTLLLLAERPPAKTLLQFDIAATPECLKALRRHVRDVGAQQGFSTTQCQELALAIDEAATNVLRHAYHGETTGEIHLQIDKLGDFLRFLLRDDGEPVDPTHFKPKRPDENRIGGLGLHLIDTIMDTWDIRTPEDGRGNLLFMSRNTKTKG